MGRNSPPPPQIIYPAAPPPAPTTQVPSQSLATQTALNEVSGKQTRLNMELGAQLDRTNADFFATQDIRRNQATAAGIGDYASKAKGTKSQRTGLKA